MTTIAIKDGVMAADSRTTDEHNLFLTRAEKITRLRSGALLGVAGDGDCRDLTELLSRCSPTRLPTRRALALLEARWDALLAFPGGRVFFVSVYQPSQIGGDGEQWTAQVNECLERCTAIGTGRDFALGAMAAGKSAREAVEIAYRYDTQSGPPVVQLDVRRKREKSK